MQAPATLLCAKCGEAADGWKCAICGSVAREHDPSRATVATHIEELVDRKVRREQRLFEPITPPGTSFGVNATVAGFGLLGIVFTVPAATAHGPPGQRTVRTASGQRHRGPLPAHDP